MVEKERNFGIDLLRNLSMLMIITVHILGEGGVLNGVQKNTVSFHSVGALEVLAFCGVNCFALISGYVANGKAIKLENVLKLWVQVVFYSVGIHLIFMVWGHSFSTVALVKSFFPISFQEYWYFTAYVGLAVVSPLLQVLIEKMPKSDIMKSLLVILFAFSVLPTLAHNDVFGTGNGYSTLWLIVLYALGGVLHRYDVFTLQGGLWMLSIGFLAAWGSHSLISMASPVGAGYFILYSSPFILMEAVGLVVIFSKLKINNLIQRFVVLCTPMSFGVYLIHTHPQVFMNLISGRFAPLATCGTLMMFAEILGTVFLIYGFCIVVDAIRRLLFRCIGIDRIIKRISSVIDAKLMSGGN